MNANLLDMRTIMFSSVASAAICAMVMAFLWAQGRHRLRGLEFWLADFMLQFVSSVFYAARGYIPDPLSILGGSILVVAAAFLLYIGLQRYTGLVTRQRFNGAYFAGAVAAHAYFTFVRPDMGARTINLSLALFVYCAQCADLLLRRVGRGARREGVPAGLILLLFALISLVRVFSTFRARLPPDMMAFGVRDAAAILTYQMLNIALTFALFLMVNRRLFADLARDTRERLVAEAALRRSDEKFAVAFNNVPDGILLTTFPEGRIVEANDAFFRMSGFTKEEAVGHTTVELNVWGRNSDRERVVDGLRSGARIRNVETVFRRRNGERIVAFASFEVIRVGDSRCVLTVIRDVTAQKEAERGMKESAAEMKRLLREAEDSRRTLLSVIEDQQIAEGEIQQQLGELRRWQSVTLDREDRILELKREVNELASRLGDKPRYGSAGEG